jgi:SAM-dependent methyltransferase
MELFRHFHLGRLRKGIRGTVAKARMIRSPHRDVLYRQIDRNLDHRNLDNAIVHSHRTLQQLWKIADRRSRVLAVGACNLLEIYTFKGYGFDNIVGVDLVRPDNDPGYIRIMDMHDLRFPDDAFDIVYCSGAFHCSYDAKRLVREFVRVTRTGGWVCITVPIDFPRNDVYRVDVGSLHGLRELFEPFLGEVQWSETVPPGSEFNPNNNTIVRAIFQIKKGDPQDRSVV